MNEELEIIGASGEKISTSAVNAFEEVEKLKEQLAEQTVRNLELEEQNRRQWCVQITLQAYSMETTEQSMLKIAEKIYEYVYGKRHEDQ